MSLFGESTGRPKRFETNSEEIISVYSLEAGFVLLMAFRREDVDAIEAGYQFFDEGSRNQAGVEGPEAYMGSTAEGDMGIWFAVELDHVRLGECLGIAVGRGPA